MTSRRSTTTGRPDPTAADVAAAGATVAGTGPASPVPAGRKDQPAAATDREVADFLAKVDALSPATTAGRGRLIFAMDATLSREPTWDMALGLQADMFAAVKSIGTLDVQLVYFRGHAECRNSKWVSDPDALARLMASVKCLGGHTQIGKVLAHARRECEARPVNALVYVGDAMEEEIDGLAHRAGELALLGVPVFLFQEGHDARAERAFREIARMTRGAWCRFDQGSALQLRELLTAVAVFASGGRRALQALASRQGGRSGAQLLIERMEKPASDGGGR